MVNRRFTANDSYEWKALILNEKPTISLLLQKPPLTWGQNETLRDEVGVIHVDCRKVVCADNCKKKGSVSKKRGKEQRATLLTNLHTLLHPPEV